MFGESLIEQYSRPSTSIFDSRNDTKESNNLFGGSSIFAEMNKRESNHSNLSLVDRMRGIQAGKLDMGTEISLAEQYNDKTLDKRTLGGAYNVTISDIYKDESLFREHHNLNVDGHIKVQESTQLEMQRDNLGTQKVDVLSVSDMNGFKDPYKSQLKDPYQINSRKQVEEQVSTSPAMAGSTGIYGTEYSPNNYKKSLIKEKKEDDDEEELLKKNKSFIGGNTGFYGLEKKQVIDEKNYDRVRIDTEAVLMAKELNLDKSNPEMVTSKKIRDEINQPYILKTYKDLKGDLDMYEQKLKDSKSEVEQSIYLKEISLIKPILIKKAIYDNF